MTAHNLSYIKDYDNGLYSEQQITVSSSERLSCWSDRSLQPLLQRAPPKIQMRQRVTGVCSSAQAGLEKWQIVGIFPNCVCDCSEQRVTSFGRLHLEAAVRFCWVVWHCEGGVITFWSSQATQRLCEECCRCPASCRPQPPEECPDRVAAADRLNYIPFSHSRCMTWWKFHLARVLSSFHREIEPQLFEVEVEHAQNFLQSLRSLQVHLTTKLLDGFTTLLMLSVHVWSCCTCPLCTIDQTLEKLVTKA